MAHAFWTSQRLFMAAVAAAVVLALLPAHWPQGRLLASLGEIVHIPMRPVEEGGTRLGRWLRPPHGDFDDFDPVARQKLELLTEELDLLQALFAQSQRRVLELEQILHELKQPQIAAGSAGVSLLVAPITGGAPNPAVEAVDLRLLANHAVKGGTVAVYGGVHLMGRVRRVWPLGCELVALTHPSTGLIRCVIMAKSKPDAAPDEGTVVQLQPVGDGTFAGDVRIEDHIGVEDVVRLDDTRWPATAQMMVIGHVESVGEKIDQPLRRTVVVRPRYRLSDLTRVVLKIQDQENPP